MKKVVISVVLAVLITYVILLVPAALIYWLASLILGIDFCGKILSLSLEFLQLYGYFSQAKNKNFKIC